MKEIRLNFYGYTWEEYAFQVSNIKGLFVIYKGQLDKEGFVSLQDILYVGYHHGIYEMYDEGCMNQIRHFIDPNDRIFLSYSEIPLDVDGKAVETILRNSIKPRFVRETEMIPSEIEIICDGACALFPEGLISKES